jgi:hypothetical protein
MGIKTEQNFTLVSKLLRKMRKKGKKVCKIGDCPLATVFGK